MALGTVQVDNENQYQSTPNEVERRFVFVGKTTITGLQGVVTALGATTDLDKIFETPEVKGDTPTPRIVDRDSNAYKFLTAAQLNAGQNWEAAFVGLDGSLSWQDALDLANKQNSYEAIVICDPMADQAAMEAVKTKMALVQSKEARYMFAMTCVAAIDPTPDAPPADEPVVVKATAKSVKTADTQAAAEPVADAVGQDWATYISALNTLATDFVAERFMCIPTLFENDLGILAGRLCDRSVTVADSPMRTKTGTLLGMGAASKDKTGAEMPDTIFSQLDAMKFSVPQNYPGDDGGWYWADGNTFDLDTGDYKVIEHLRVVLKACRQVYKIAVPTIADRSLNSTPSSIAKNKQLYMSPLLAMAKTTYKNGVPFPGEIQPPTDNAVEIVWVSDKKTDIFITVKPYTSQKEIKIGVGIDLSLQTQ